MVFIRSSKSIEQAQNIVSSIVREAEGKSKTLNSGDISYPYCTGYLEASLVTAVSYLSPARLAEFKKIMGIS